MTKYLIVVLVKVVVASGIILTAFAVLPKHIKRANLSSIKIFGICLAVAMLTGWMMHVINILFQ